MDVQGEDDPETGPVRKHLSSLPVGFLDAFVVSDFPFRVQL